MPRSSCPRPPTPWRCASTERLSSAQEQLAGELLQSLARIAAASAAARRTVEDDRPPAVPVDGEPGG